VHAARPVAAQRFNVILVTHDLRESGVPGRHRVRDEQEPRALRGAREIDLPRPRDLEITYTRFTDIVHELRGHIGAIRKPGRAARQGPRHEVKSLETLAAPWMLLVATLLVWQLFCSAFGVSEFIFPSPLQIALALGIHRWTDRRPRLAHLLGDDGRLRICPSWWACCWAS
jgi:hypothetical protein